MAKKMTVTTSLAYIIWAILLSAAFYYTGFKPTAHFMIYAFFLTLGLFSIVAKRLAQKMARFKDTEIK